MLNKLRVIPFLLLVIIATEPSILAADFCEKKTELYNRWPFSPGRAITESADYIFYGDGDIVSVMDKDTLAYVSSIHVDVSEGITGIDYSNGYLFVTTGFDGLQSIQVESDGSLTLGSPLAIKSTVDDGVSIYARGVHVSGSYAYVGIAEVTSEGNINIGVQVVDIINPGSPAIPDPDPDYPDDPFGGRGELVGTENIPYGRAETLGIRVSGDYAYVVDWVNGLQIFNIENKKKPLFVGLAIAPDARDAQIVGDYAFVACANYGLIVVNISDPESEDDPINQRPTLQCLYDWDETFAKSVFISGDYAYMTDNYDRMVVVDISGDLDDKFATSHTTDDPTYGEQFLVGSISTGLSGPYSVFVSGGFAYVAEFETGLHKIDVSDPESPSSTALTFDKTAVADGFFLYNFNDINYAYVVNSNGADEGLRILQFDVSLAIRQTAVIETPGEARGVYVQSETNDNGSVSLYAYIADGTNGLQIIDVTSSSVPVMKGVYAGANQAKEVYVRGNYAYVADGSNGLRIIRITDKDAPVLAGSLSTSDARDILVPTGDYAYVADGTAGLVIVDISDRYNPAISATVNTPGEASAVYIYGNYAFVADGTQGLQIISLDESNSAEYHTIVGSIATDGGDAQGIYIVDNYAHVADGASGFQTFDVSNPSSPVKIYSNIDCDDDGITNEKGWFWDTKGYAKDLVVDDEGEYVILADGPGGLSLYRLTDEDADASDATIEPSEAVNDCFIASVSGEGDSLYACFSYLIILTGLGILTERLISKRKLKNS